MGDVYISFSLTSNALTNTEWTIPVLSVSLVSNTCVRTCEMDITLNMWQCYGVCASRVCLCVCYEYYLVF